MDGAFESKGGKKKQECECETFQSEIFLNLYFEQVQELFQRGWSDCPTPFTINLLYTKKRPQLGKISGAQKGGWPAAWWS